MEVPAGCPGCIDRNNVKKVEKYVVIHIDILTKLIYNCNIIIETRWL